jgi:hypothetical protein
MNLKQAQANATARGLPKSVHNNSTHIIVLKDGGVVEGWGSQEYADVACKRLNEHAVTLFGALGATNYHVEALEPMPKGDAR